MIAQHFLYIILLIESLCSTRSVKRRLLGHYDSAAGLANTVFYDIIVWFGEMSNADRWLMIAHPIR